jgi:hypothetical protein
MAQLYAKVKEYAKANNVNNLNFLTDVVLQDDGNGAYISTWNLSIPKPTDEQLASYESAANITEKNDMAIMNRQTEYGSWSSQLEEIYDNGIDKWKERIKSIKDKHPKG